MSARPVVAVFGASGRQGGGVARALERQGMFSVRALGRDLTRLVGLGDEQARADLDRGPEELVSALEGAYGLFLVTDFWSRGTSSEGEQARAVLDAARRVGVEHFVWSTLPDVARISAGRYRVPHFSDKAAVNAMVSQAGFAHHTFVEAPFYYQNLTGQMAPHDLGDGRRGWALPLPADARVVHAGDISELGSVVAGAFALPDRVGSGQVLSLAGDLLSFDDIVTTLGHLGRDVVYREIPHETFALRFPGAEEMAHMMQYWSEFTYFGPGAEEKVALAREVAIRPFTPFSPWAAVHMAGQS